MVCRLLPVDEWWRLENTYLGPLRRTVNPDTTTALVVEEADRIVGTWTAMKIWHVEGLSLTADPSVNGVVFRMLLRRMRALLNEGQIPAVVSNADTPKIQDWMPRLGGVPIPGTGYVWRP